MKNLALLLIISALSPTIFANTVELTGKAIPNCRAHEIIELKYRIIKNIPEKLVADGGLTNKSEQVCEVILRVTTKRDGTVCSENPPVKEDACKFTVDNKAIEMYPIFTYSIINNWETDPKYAFSKKGNEAMIGIYTRTSENSPLHLKSDINFNVLAGNIPRESRFYDYLKESKLGKDNKNPEDGVIVTVLMTRKSL